MHFFFSEESKIATSYNGTMVTVNWSDCFIYTGRLVYEVSVGTTLGGADIIQWQETLNDYMKVGIPEKYRGQAGLNLFFFVRAIGENGEYNSLSNNILV